MTNNISNKIKSKESNNYAFIDSQNLNLGIRDQGWKIDWNKLFVYMKDKLNVSKSFIFIGYYPGNEDLYKFLQNCGYTLIFKPVLESKNGKVKGNVDAELVLHTMIELNNFNKAVIISGDGDFHCLIKHLFSIDKLKAVGIPNKKQYSSLLRKFSNKFVYISDIKKKVEYKGT